MVKMKMILNMITAWVKELFRRVRSLALARRSTAVIMTAVMLLSVVSAVVIPQVNKSLAQEEIQNKGKIIAFEKNNPVYSGSRPIGTAEDNCNLPETIRAEVELEEDTDNFIQTEVPPDQNGEYSYYNYGYVIDKNSESNYKNGNSVLFTIYYADGSKAYRVHGKLGGDGTEAFFGCDRYGNISSVIMNIPVTWSCKKYKADTAGEYEFTASFEGYKYKGEDIKATLVLENITEENEGECGVADCTCSVGNKEYSSLHDKTCAYYDEGCTCSQHNTTPSTAHDKSCKYHVADITTKAPCSCGIDAECDPWQHNPDCPLFEEPTKENGGCSCPDGVHDPDNEFCLLNCFESPDESSAPEGISTGEIKVPVVRAPGGGTDAFDTMLNSICPTSGNANDSALTFETLPGTWIDYLRTIFRNQYNKDFNWATAAVANAYNGWVWGGTTATQTTGTVATNRLRIPVVASGYWNVYSGEQLYYALAHATNGQVVRMMGNINLNGANKNWPNVSTTYSVQLRGQGYTISNLSSSSGGLFTTAYKYSYNGGSDNIIFRNCRCYSQAGIGNNRPVGIINMLTSAGNTVRYSFTNIFVYDSVMFNGKAHDNGFNSSASVMGGATNDTANLVCADNCIIYGGDHIASVFVQGDLASFTNSYAVDCTVIGIGYHSGGYNSCTNSYAVHNNCFTSIHVYGGFFQGGLSASAGTDTNCFATGIVEGYKYLAGYAIYPPPKSSSYTCRVLNCYSTCLVGMRSDYMGYLGGFYSDLHSPTLGMSTNCYSAGEVGDFTVDMTNPVNVGGFTGVVDGVAGNALLTNCYYDKQTSAMREWAAGDTKSVANVKGLLTSTTTKAGVGMASGSDFGLGTTDWVYEAEHYPQLSVYVNATTTSYKYQAAVDRVKAFSEASVSTVFLDTWDKGYDWSDDGVRTKVENSYDRTLASTGKTDHKGYELTYDTVREIVTDFTATLSDRYTGAKWVEWIPNGAPALDSDGFVTQDTIYITNSNGKGTIENPGMNWYTVHTTVNGVDGWRPIRLIAFMNVEAGSNKTVYTGSYYNHRNDVSLSMVDYLVDNLVVGMDDTRIWSKIKTGGYPTKSDTDSAFSDKYYAAPTDHTNNLSTNFSASDGGWLYTEIWTAEKTGGSYSLDPDGNYIPEFSVYVTGAGTGNNTTDDEKKWNGEYPMAVDTSAGKKYIITYYWMLEDGRYRTDTKYIDILPGKFDLNLNVFNFRDNSINDTALYLGTSKDYVASPMDYNTTVSNDLSSATTTSNTSSLLDAPFATNVSASWKKEMDVTTVDKIRITMKTTEGTTVGTQTVTLDDGTGVIDGTEITVPILYTYLTYVYDPVQDANREVTKAETVNVTYKVVYDTAKGQYDLQFAKIWNTPPTETEILGDDEGIPDATLAYINDICYDTFVDLWVSEVEDFKVQKTLSTPAEENEVFMFRADFCGNGTTAGAVESTQYVRLNIAAGDSSAIANFKDMPLGWYKVTELDSNWRFDLTDNLVTLNPTANSVNDSTITYFLGTPITGGGVFTFKFNDERKDTPWAHGKTDIVNDMPATSE